MLDHHDAQAVGAIAAIFASWYALKSVAPGLTVEFAALLAIGVGGAVGWHLGASVKRAWRARQRHWMTWRSVRPRPSKVRVATYVVILALSVFAVAAVYGTGVAVIDDAVGDTVAGEEPLAPPADGSAEDDAPTELNTTEVERLIHRKVNERRAERGMEPLPWNDRAARKARAHAEDMAEKGYFNHTSLDGETQQERYAFCNGGENAGKTFVDRPVLEPDGGTSIYQTEEKIATRLVEGWMDSDPHRERGIYGDRWSSTGVGIAITETGEVYAVQGFCSR